MSISNELNYLLDSFEKLGFVNEWAGSFHCDNLIAESVEFLILWTPKIAFKCDIFATEVNHIFGENIRGLKEVLDR